MSVFDFILWFFPLYLQVDGFQYNHFPGLEKDADDAKDSGKHMADMCLIKTADPQRFSHIFNNLENGTILGKSTDMYPRILLRHMMFFASKRDQKLAHVFTVTASTWVFISEKLETRIIYPLLVLTTYFTGMSCAITVIGRVTTLFNTLHLIVVGKSRSPSSWVINPLRPPQFRNNWSILIGFLLDSYPTVSSVIHHFILSCIKDYDPIRL